jgi:glycosyltransferase involved in cell wall biosynthesis
MNNPLTGRREPIFLSVVFSFRNEENVLPELIKRVRAVLLTEKQNNRIKGHELIFVNDASTDASLEILHKAYEELKDIRVINMSRCFGVGRCTMAGFKFAKGDAVIYMDADLQDPPEVIPQMIDAYFADKDVDVVHTVRRRRDGESWVKLKVTKLGYIILNKFSTIHLPMDAGDFKMLSRRVVTHLNRLTEGRPFVRGLVCWVGFKQVFVKYDRLARFAGESKFNVFGPQVLSNFFGSALISFSAAPLKLAVVFGLTAIFFDLLLLGHAFYEKIEGRAIPGWTAIMIAVLFVGAVQLFCVGIFGLYIDSLHEQSRNRPNFVINNVFGFSEEELKGPARGMDQEISSY